MHWLLRPIHQMWHLVTAFFAIVCGVWLSQLVPWLNWWWLILGVLLVGLAMWRQRRALLLAAAIGGMLIGLARGGALMRDLAVYDTLYGHRVTIEGQVMSDVSMNARGQSIVTLAGLSSKGRPLSGELRLIITSHAPALQRSDRVSADGILERGYSLGTISMTVESAAAHREQVSDPLLTVRDTLSRNITEAIHGAAGSLGIGYLLGQKQALPTHLQEAMQVVGLTHIVVASGYNLTILVRLMRRSFEKISRYLTFMMSGGLVVAFIGMTGLSPSMTRAGLVTILSLAAWYVGRKFHPVMLLGLVAMLTTIWDPTYAWGDIGWLLSFAAFAGVMVVAPLVTAYFYGDKKPGFIAQVLIETSAAQLMTAPIIMVTFGTFSNIALLANILIVPIIPITMLLVFIAAICSWLPGLVAGVLTWPAQTILDATIALVSWLAELPGAQSHVTTQAWMIIVWYVCVLGGCLYCKWRTGYRLAQASVVE